MQLSKDQGYLLSDICADLAKALIINMVIQSGLNREIPILLRIIMMILYLLAAAISVNYALRFRREQLYDH